MSANKKQHFIPKFYLKYFSFQKNEKEIGVYIKKNNLFVQQVSLRDQAYLKYFYGKDGVLEKALGELEDKTKPLFNRIIDEKYCPDYSSEEYILLLYFTVCLDLRNPLHSKNMVATLNQILQKIAPEKLNSKEFEMISQHAPYVQLENLDVAVGCCSDLKLKIFHNMTSIPFVTSDYPVIKYNQYLEKRKWDNGDHGFLSLGLQYFVPISPNVMLYFYDDWAYKVGGNNPHIIKIKKEDEIKQLNLLQYLNSEEVLFFNDKTYKDMLEGLKLEANSFLQPNLPELNKRMDLNHKRTNPNTNIYMHKTSSIRTKLVLSFIKESSEASTRPFDKLKLDKFRKAYWGKETEIRQIIKSLTTINGTSMV